MCEVREVADSRGLDVSRGERQCEHADDEWHDSVSGLNHTGNGGYDQRLDQPLCTSGGRTCSPMTKSTCEKKPMMMPIHSALYLPILASAW